MGLRVQGVSVGWAQNRTSARGEHEVLLGAQRLNGLLFGITERRLSMLIEEIADRHADVPLDFVIAVNEPQTQLTSQVPPDGGLATTGHADQADFQSRINWGWCRAILRPNRQVW